jgi:1-acyl-sn-glycerol-3-phosphate acyltransferase
MIGLAIASKAYTDRTHYAPMDDRALAKYRFFSKLGFFPVRPDSRRGAVSLLRHGAAILAQPNSTLWLTPQGHFTDMRARPTEFRPGIGHLARRIERGMAVPMALEVTFWNERSPEALVRFGDPIDFDGAHRDDSSADWTGRLERALEVTQDALAEEVMRRRPNDFDTLLGGRAGVGGVYDIWRRFKAALHGRAFHPEHDREAP